MIAKLDPVIFFAVNSKSQKFRIALALFILVSSSKLCSGLTFVQMEQGSAVSTSHKSGLPLTVEQMASLTALRNFSEGFFAIAFNAPALSPTEDANGVYKPSKWMRDPVRCETSLQDFIVRYKPYAIDSTKIESPQAIFLAWYLCNCDGSDGRAKFKANVLLVKCFGANYPSQDDLIKKMDEEMGRATEK